MNKLSLAALVVFAAMSAQTVGAVEYADGLINIAAGGKATAEGNAAMAIGPNAVAKGNQAFALGINAQAIADEVPAGKDPNGNMTAIGLNAKATKTDALAVGTRSEATAVNSTAVGAYAQARGDYAFAGGADSYAFGNRSVAIGVHINENELKKIVTHDDKTNTNTVNENGFKDFVKYNETLTNLVANETTRNELLSDVNKLNELVADENKLKAAVPDEKKRTDLVNYQKQITELRATLVKDGLLARLGRSNQYGATGDFAVAIGNYALAQGWQSVAMGNSATATGLSSVALGDQSKATGAQSFAGGPYANASGEFSVALGNNTQSTGGQSVAIGDQAKSTGQYSVAVGYDSLASVVNGGYEGNSAFGARAKAFGVGSTAIGNNAQANNPAGNENKKTNYGTAVGTSAYANKAYATALGTLSRATGDRSIGIGVSTGDGKVYGATGDWAIGIGGESLASGHQSVALGMRSSVTKDWSIAIGPEAKSSGLQSISLGKGANSTATLSAAIGDTARATGNQSIAFGASALSSGPDSVSIGTLAESSGVSSISIGDSSGASAFYAASLGVAAYASGEQSIALGTFAESNILQGVALGARSKTTVAKDVIGYNPLGLSLEKTLGADYESYNSQFNALKAYEKIDQLNVSRTQLNTQINQLTQERNAENTTDERKSAIDTEIQQYTADIKVLDDQIAEQNKIINGAQRADVQTGSDKLGHVWRGTRGAVSVGDADKYITRQINNVAAGTLDTDAVNVAQLKLLAGAPVTVYNGGNVANSQYNLGTQIDNGNVHINNLRFAFTDGLKAELQKDKDQNNVVVVSLSGGGNNGNNGNNGTAGKDGKDGKDGRDGRDGKDGTILTPDSVVTVKEVHTGKTVVNNKGVVINKEGDKNEVSITENGLDNGGNRAVNIADGQAPTDAVNRRQLDQVENRVVERMESRLRKERRRADAGTASAIAQGAIPQVTIPGARGLGVGGGHYGNQSAVSIGGSAMSDNGKWIFKSNVSANSQGKFGVGAGVLYQWR